MIREARAADRAAIVALQLASWRDAYAGVLPDAYLADGLACDLTERWAGRDFAPPLVTLIAAPDLGFVCCLTDRAVPYIDNLHTRPDQRSRGIGRAMMTALFDCLRRAGAGAAELTVLQGNPRARAFYARLGGVEAAPRPAALFGHPVVEVPVRFPL